jgi:4-azaleucine resistance transporter AzlC
MSSRFASARHRFTGFDRGGFARGVVASLSIASGYVPIAISFGLVAVQSGLEPLTAVLASALIYAGASQFVLVSLLTANAGFLGTLVTLLLMNARHVFYGPALARKLPRGASRFPRAWWAAGLTDEVFVTSLALLDQIPEHDREAWYLGLQLGAYAAWVGGTGIGVMSGAQFAHLPSVAQHALQFVLPALFMALLLELASRNGRIVILVAAAATWIALHALPTYQAIPIGMVIGALSMSWRKP